MALLASPNGTVADINIKLFYVRGSYPFGFQSPPLYCTIFKGPSHNNYLSLAPAAFFRFVQCMMNTRQIILLR